MIDLGLNEGETVVVLFRKSPVPVTGRVLNGVLHFNDSRAGETPVNIRLVRSIYRLGDAVYER